MVYVLNYETVDEFKEQYKNVEAKYNKGDLKEYRYNGCFETARSFWNYMKSEELGTRN